MTRPCPKCNQMNPPNAAFCLNCASPMAEAPPFIGQQQAQQLQYWPGQNVGVNIPMVGVQSGSGSGQKAMIAMILAIVAFLCCGPFTGVPAAIVGWMALDAIKNGREPADSKWMAMIGLWGGIAATLIHGVGYVFWVLLSAMSASSPYGY